MDRQTDRQTQRWMYGQTDREKSSPPEPNSYYNKLHTPALDNEEVLDFNRSQQTHHRERHGNPLTLL